MTSWITRRRPQPEPVPDYSAELIEADRRIRDAVRVIDAALREHRITVDVLLDVRLSLTGGQG